MKSWPWIVCSLVLFALAAVDYWVLWRSRGHEGGLRMPFSPFSLAAQGTFAVFAGLFALTQALEDPQPGEYIKYGELAFLLLMSVGVIADWRGRSGQAERD